MLLLLGGFGVTALAIVRKDFLGHDPNSKNELWKVFDFLPSIQGEGVTVEGTRMRATVGRQLTVEACQ